MKEFEDNLKKKSKENKANGKNETKPKTKRTTKSKKAKIDESGGENQTDEEPSINIDNGNETSLNEENGTHDTSGLDVTNGDELATTMSRLRSTCKSFLNSTSKYFFSV